MGRPCAGTPRAQRRDAGFVTPVGWLFLFLTILFVLGLVAVIWFFVAGSHSTIARRTAEQVATRGSQLGLSILITPPAPGSPGSVIDMAEPLRTQVLTEYIVDNVLPPDSSLWRYLAPIEPGVDVILSLNATTVSVSVTARAGRNGQFVRTRTASASVAAANFVASGRVSPHTGLPGGVLPLALDASALDATVLARTAGIVSRRAVALHVGRNAFPASIDDASEPHEMLHSVSSFLASSGSGSPSPAMRIGQRLQLAREGSSSSPDAEEPAPLLALGIFDRPVIVPVVRGDVVAAFAVGRLHRSDDGLVFDPMASAPSPLTGFDEDAPGVSSDFRHHGLALAFRPTEPSEERVEPLLGDEREIG